MRPNTKLWNAVGTSAATAAALLTIAATAGAQARNLRDPGRLFTDHAAQMSAASTSTYNLFLTPTFGWDDNNQLYGGQLRYTSTSLLPNMPVAISGTIAEHRFTAGSPAVSKMAMQVNGEVDVLSTAQYILSVSGEMQNTADFGTQLELAPEFDWMLPANSMFTGAVGGIAYLDRFKTSTGDFVTKGRTLGLIGYLNHGTWSVIPEYDFDSDYVGEDSFSVKVAKSFANMKRDPRIILGASKHNSFVAGVRMKLH
jgi:hypothetical protein